MNDIDKLNKRVDNEGVYYAKLARRVADLERRSDLNAQRVATMERVHLTDAREVYRQEYGSVQPTPTVTVTSLVVSDKEMSEAARTFVKSIGTVNRGYLKVAVQDKNGDAARALYNAIALYPAR